MKALIVDDRCLETPLVKKFLKENKMRFRGSSQEFQYKEGVLEEGETITVVGKAQWKSKSELGLDVPSEKILVIEPNQEKGEPVYLSDDLSLNS